MPLPTCAVGWEGWGSLTQSHPGTSSPLPTLPQPVIRRVCPSRNCKIRTTGCYSHHPPPPRGPAGTSVARRTLRASGCPFLSPGLARSAPRALSKINPQRPLVEETPAPYGGAARSHSLCSGLGGPWAQGAASAPPARPHTPGSSVVQAPGPPGTRTGWFRSLRGYLLGVRRVPGALLGGESANTQSRHSECGRKSCLHSVGRI